MIGRPIALPLLGALALAGCGGSPPTHFYALTAVPAGRSATASAAAPVTVRRVMLTPVLDRQSLVTTGAGDRLTISSEDRWAAPLDEQFRRVLAADLAQRLASPVLIPGDPVPSGTAGIAVNVRRFAGDADGNVTLLADWSLLRGDSTTPVAGASETVTVAAGGTGADQVTAAMSRAIGVLADRIAAAIGGRA